MILSTNNLTLTLDIIYSARHSASAVECTVPEDFKRLYEDKANYAKKKVLKNMYANDAKPLYYNTPWKYGAVQAPACGLLHSVKILEPFWEYDSVFQNILHFLLHIKA